MLDLTNPSRPDWRTQFSQSFRDSHQLADYLETQVPEVSYPILIPKVFAEKIKLQGKEGPLWKQFVPSHLEEASSRAGLVDPISDHKYAVEGGIIHRYPNRILFSPTEICPIQCRYCFRKNELHTGDDLFKANHAKLIAYLQENPTVEEVIFTGGDPFILSNDKIEMYLSSLEKVSSVKFIRFHTRTPIILPERLDIELAQILSYFGNKFEAITIIIHSNHASEVEPSLSELIKPFLAGGIHFLSQSVLLRGVNDDPQTLTQLFKRLYSLNIKPYYLHHPDPVKGAMHFTLPLSEGREIYRKLKKSLSGIMLPHYIVELPNGGGKSIAHTSQQTSNGFWYDKEGDLVEFLTD